MSNLNAALDRLKSACQNPKAQLERCLQQGKTVIGCFPPYTPEELIHASGMIPMGLWGGKIDLLRAKSYLPAFACPIMQANIELGLKGSYEGLSAVIIPAMCDTLRCMTQNWRFGVPSIPMIPIVYPQNRSSSASTDYLISEYEHILALLCAHTGMMMNEEALKETICVYNRHNAVMREFCAVANEHLDVITPSVRHSVMKSAFFFEKGEHSGIVEEIIAGLKELPACDFKGKKVILTGISCEPEDILTILEENNIAVVGDDLAQESRQYRADTPLTGGGGLKRLALQWNARYGCSMIHEDGKPRGKMLADMCSAVGADGVITCLMKFCDPEEYDIPYLAADLQKAGYPHLCIEADPLSSNCETLRTRIQSYGEII